MIRKIDGTRARITETCHSIEIETMTSVWLPRPRIVDASRPCISRLHSPLPSSEPPPSRSTGAAIGVDGTSPTLTAPLPGILNGEVTRVTPIGRHGKGIVVARIEVSQRG